MTIKQINETIHCMSQIKISITPQKKGFKARAFEENLGVGVVGFVNEGYGLIGELKAFCQACELVVACCWDKSKYDCRVEASPQFFAAVTSSNVIMEKRRKSDMAPILEKCWYYSNKFRSFSPA